MTKQISHFPTTEGQLVWCPGDPSLGIGLVTGREGSHLKVQFWTLREERCYTTRSKEIGVLRYGIGQGERVQDDAGNDYVVLERLAPSPEGLAMYQLDNGQAVPESALRPRAQFATAKERLAALQLSHPETVRARLQGLKLAQFGARAGQAAIVGSRVALLPHQLDVASQAIQQDPVRLLLADEVGLGKTVEAALIYAGLRQEQRANRVLVITPNALCIQWLGELYRKSHELLVLMDQARLADAIQDFPHLNPFEAYHRMVVGLDQIVQDSTLADYLCQPNWDLIIVDEAHHCRWDNQPGEHSAYGLLARLAQKTKHLLLLTATPMALNPSEYHALLRLLDPVQFADPKRFATIAEQTGQLRTLSQGLLRYVQSGDPLAPNLQQQLCQTLADNPQELQVAQQFCGEQQLATAAGKALVPALLEGLKERHGLARYVIRNRRGPVGGLPNRMPHLCAIAPSPAQEILLEVGETFLFELAESIPEEKDRYQVLGTCLRSLWATPQALQTLVADYSPSLAEELIEPIAALRAAPLDADGLPTGDSRLAFLLRLLRQIGPEEKVLVFVETAIAVRALKEALEPFLQGHLAVFHGELSPRDQDRQVAYFRAPNGPQVMISTEAGGEGRNFQFCHHVVLYDLPWQPSVVEQRIGRIDRVGQAEDVQVWVPYFGGGYEAAVVKIMQQSIGVLGRTIGGIDHHIEQIAPTIAKLILEQASVEAWQDLFRSTANLVQQVRQQADGADEDPLLDQSSFQPERAAALLAQIPATVEAQMERFVHLYAEHNHLELHPQGNHCIGVEGAVGAAGREDMACGYTATFRRLHALDHEDVEFLSFGHPLVEQALEWSKQEEEGQAALALCRGFEQEGAAFLWVFMLDIGESSVGALRNLFPTSLWCVAVDEQGKRLPQLETFLWDSERRLERMDAKPLRQQASRWRAMIEQQASTAQAIAEQEVDGWRQQAEQRLQAWCSQQEARAQRALHRAKESGSEGELQACEQQWQLLCKESDSHHQQLLATRPRMVAALALRLVGRKRVSG